MLYYVLCLLQHLTQNLHLNIYFFSARRRLVPKSNLAIHTLDLLRITLILNFFLIHNGQIKLQITNVNQIYYAVVYSKFIPC